MKKQKPPYYAILPEDLHQDADDLIYYLETFLFETPSCCYHCQSRSFYCSSVSQDGIKYYTCNRCDRCFNQLTNTYFARSQYPDKWAPFAVLRLSGYSLRKLAEKIGFSANAAKIRDKKFLKIMQEEQPRLYEWWSVHQNRQDISLTPLILAQREELKAWITEILEQKTAVCPRCRCGDCHRISRISHRAQFECPYCLKSFNIFSGTPFRYMHFPERWTQYVDFLTQGAAHYDIAQKLGISKRSLIYWRNNMMKQIDIMELHALKSWINWQRSRRCCHEGQ